MLLSDDELSKSRGLVGVTAVPAFSGPPIDGEKETLYTGAEWPMSRRELDGGGSFGPVGKVDFRASPLRFQTRMYDSSVPQAISV